MKRLSLFMWFFLVCLFVLTKCSSPTELSAEYSRFWPPDIYKTWYLETQRCAGLEAKADGTFTKLQFFTVYAPTFEVNGRNALAAEKDWKIWIVESRIFDKRVVEHEMMHSLTGYRTHPEIFKTCKLLLGQ